MHQWVTMALFRMNKYTRNDITNNVFILVLNNVNLGLSLSCESLFMLTIETVMMFVTSRAVSNIPVIGCFRSCGRRQEYVDGPRVVSARVCQQKDDA